MVRTPLLDPPPSSSRTAHGSTSALVLALALALGCRPTLTAMPPGSPPLVLHAGAPVASLPRGSIDVLVWNIHKARRAAWGGELQGLAADVQLVLLQEVYQAPRMTEVLARDELEWLMARSFVYERRRGAPATGVAIGSVARALGSEAQLSPDPEPLTSTPKAALVARYAIEGRDGTLLVVCIHAINFRGADALAAQLAALGPVLEHHAGPVLLAGDLNTHHPARVAVLERFAAAHQLRAVFADGTTRDGRKRFAGRPLDHVLVRGLVVERARVVREARGSDHAPLQVRVSMPTR